MKRYIILKLKNEKYSRKNRWDKKKKEQVGQKKKKKQEMVDVTQIFQSFILIMNGLHAFVKSCLSY